MERTADGFALDVGALIVGERGCGVVAASGSSLELAPSEGKVELAALDV